MVSNLYKGGKIDFITRHFHVIYDWKCEFNWQHIELKEDCNYCK